MPPRSTWKGFLRLSLVSVPVKAYTANAAASSGISLHQLHEECHNRIQYRKTCPVHGEVGSDEIVSGYEFAKGQFVVISPEELDKIRTEGDRSVNIDSFIRPEQLDPIYFDKTYYLVPDGPVGERPYAVLREAMVKGPRNAIGQVVLSNRERTVLLRPLDGLLAMTTLHYDNEVKKPSAFEDEVPGGKVSKEELELAKLLIDAKTAKDFDFSRYHDVYVEQLTKVIEAKVEGKEISAPTSPEEPRVINLMDALRQSVARAKESEKPAAPKKPRKKVAKSKSPRAASKRKRKSS